MLSYLTRWLLPYRRPTRPRPSRPRARLRLEALDGRWVPAGLITSPNTATFTAGAFGAFTVTTSGFPTPALAESGGLPGNVHFFDNGDGTAALSGAPTAAGTFPVTFTASDGVPPVATQSFTLTVLPAPVAVAPTFTSANNTTFTAGAYNSFTVTTAGYPTASLYSGPLPAGLQFTDNGDGTATLVGIPFTLGQFGLTLTASNGVIPDSIETLVLNVVPAGGTVLPPPPAVPGPSLDPGPMSAFAVGADVGGAPEVKVYDAVTNQLRFDFDAYDPHFTGGVRVAVGDVTGDGTPDIITAPGAGGGPQVKVFDGKTGALVTSFFAYDPSFTGGVNVAAADVNGDGFADIVTGTGVGGSPNVKVFDGKTGAVLRSFYAYEDSFRGGVNVAAGDVTGDGRADVITGTGVGGGPRVQVFDGVTGAQVWNYFAYDPSFRGGVNVAAGDVTGDGRADVVTGTGVGGGPAVTVFDGTTGVVAGDWLAFDPGFRGGVAVETTDVNADGRVEVLVAPGAGTDPVARVFDGTTGAPIRDVQVFDPHAQNIGVTTGDGTSLPS
jgi:hypothetical protein